MKLFFALGTRPEAIKLAPLVLRCQAAADIEVTVCNTGQHKSLTRDMLAAFGVRADIDLNIMRPGQSLTQITTNILREIEQPLIDCKPDWVLVQGDTTTSFAAALAAFYQKIPVGHVEAGLRTGDRYSPWPEEINRRLNTALATLHFAPTERSRDNLLAEGIAADQVSVTGNTGIDALFRASEILESDAAIREGVIGDLVDKGLDFLKSPAAVNDIVIVTAHRRENFGAGLESICSAIVDLARLHPHLKFVFPVHPNPEVTGPVDRIIRSASFLNVYLTAPLDYFPFTYLLKNARLVVSDSGGIQEESVSLGRRIVILREETERVELVGQPDVWIVGTDRKLIINAVDAALDQATACQPSGLFGDGRAAQRILSALEAAQ